MDSVRRIFQRRYGRFILPRQLLKKALKKLATRNYVSMIGAEIEWYLLRVADDHLSEHNIGTPGFRGVPIRTWPVEPGYHYHSESNMDLMQPVFDALATPLRRSGSGCGRSKMNGDLDRLSAPSRRVGARGGGQRSAVSHRDAPDMPAARLFRNFHGRPAIKGYYASGWHLHQSLVDASSGANLFMPQNGPKALSPLGLSYLAGLLQYAVPGTVFSTPTVNGYRRFKPNSLAPDRSAWAYDNRGAMLRVLGGPDDPATRMENRTGEPCSQSLSLHSLADRRRPCRHQAKLAPPPANDEPYAAERPMLPKNLPRRWTPLRKSRCSERSSAIHLSTTSSN
jgi:glutamine synthetase